MANTDLCFLYSLVILFIASHTCDSLECTQQNVYKCHKDNSINGCPKPRGSIACLQSLDRCDDDEVQLMIDTNIKGYQKSIDHCPGLPDGMCLRAVIDFCDYKVPYNVLEVNTSHFYMPYDVRMEACQGFKGKSKDVSACLEKIKPKCKSDDYIAYIDSIIVKVGKTETYCTSLMAQ